MVSVPVDRGVSIVRRGRVWQLVVVVDGRRARESLHTQDRQKALAVAREMAAAVISGRWNVAMSGISVSKLVKDYTESESKVHHAPATRQLVDDTLIRFEAWCDARNITTTDKLRREHVESFLQARAKEKGPAGKLLSPGTVNRDLAWLRRLFQWALDRGLIRMNVADGVRRYKVNYRVKYTLTGDEIGKLIGKAHSGIIKDILVLLANTGLRISEALDIRKDDVKLDNQTLLVRSPKVHAERIVPLNAPALAVLSRRALAAGSSGLIFATAKGKIISRNNVGRAIRTAAIKAGIPKASPHALRRSFATVCSTVLPQLALQKLMGHSSPSTTATYYVKGTVGVPPPVMATEAS